MVICCLLNKVSDFYYESIYPGWNKSRKIAEEILPHNERHKARKVLRNFAYQVAQKGKNPMLSYGGILRSLESAKSLRDLEQRCLVLSKMSGLFQEKEAWLTACTSGYIDNYVKEALDVIKEHGDFSLTYKYTPPKSHTDTTIETVEYGGTGANAYYVEYPEVEKVYYTPEKLEVHISPLSKKLLIPKYNI